MSSNDSNTNPEPQLKRERNEIEADLKKVEVAFGGLQDRGTKITEEFADVIDKGSELQKKIEEFTNDDKGQDLIDLRKSLNGRDLQFYDAVVPIYNEANEITKKQESLQREYTPYLESDLVEIINELGETLDYSAMLKYYYDKDIFSGTGTSDLLINTLLETSFLRQCQYQIVTGEKNFTYHDNVYKLNTLTTYKEKWISKGFLNKSRRRDESSQTTFLDKDEERQAKVFNEFKDTTIQLNRFMKLSEVYKPTLVFKSSFDFSLDDITNCLDANRITNYFQSVSIDISKIGLDPLFFSAAEAFLFEIRTNYEQKGFLPKVGDLPINPVKAAEKVRGVDLNDIKIIGVDSEDNVNVLLNSASIRRSILEPLPRGFLKGVRSITYGQKPTDIDKTDPTVETVGLCKPVFDDNKQLIGSEIGVFQPLVVESVNKEKNVLDRQKLIEITWHETGHNAHASLDIDEMEKWEETVVADKTLITWYVKYSESDKSDGENRRKREDFCESFTMFMDDPALLSVLSPKRFDYMYELFMSHTPEEQKADFYSMILGKILITRSVWKDGGYDENAIKELYLHF